MSDATFTCPDVTTFAGLEDLGLEITGQLFAHDREVLAWVFVGSNSDSQTADQPSREAYVGAFDSPQHISWWPNSASIDLPVDERRALSTVCLEYPPAEVMYGF